MSNFEVDKKETQIIRLKYEDDVLEGLTEEIKKAGIENGIITNGIGSATSYHIHVVESTGLPPGNVYFKDEGPYDIVNMQGYILDGQVHAHISFADAHNGSQFGGHLEPGCSVLTFCIITIVETGPLGDLDSFEIPEK